MGWLAWVLLVCGVIIVVSVVVVGVLMARATPVQLREATHRMGRAKIPGPGGLYNVPSDKEFRETKLEHPSHLEFPSPDWCEACQGIHLPGECPKGNFEEI